MMHDFAVTKQYAIFPYFPLVLRPECKQTYDQHSRIVLLCKDFDRVYTALAKFDGRSPFRFDKTLKARFGILPRDAENEVRL
jgi:carotenoid cleavage dioxygenase-like enzyme